MIKKVFCLMGPTASGKTALSLSLARAFPFEIISVDSALIYREMDIGTAKPSPAELALAPHHLIDILDPPETFSADQFCKKASQLIEEIWQRKHYPLLVGGTMMYFHALLRGLSDLPGANPALRAQLMTEDLSSLYQKLSVLDAVAAEKIKPNDKQRIYRALEIMYARQESLTTLFAKEKPKSPYLFFTTQLMPTDRALLHQHIAQRFHQMLEQGFLKEVEAILSKWQLPPDCPSLRAVGYKQARAFLAGEMSYAELVEKAIIATRQLAKRQLTWLRNWQGEVDCKGSQEAIYACIAAEMQALRFPE